MVKYDMSMRSLLEFVYHTMHFMAQLKMSLYDYCSRHTEQLLT